MKLPLSETERKFLCNRVAIPIPYILRLRTGERFTREELQALAAYIAAEADETTSLKKRNVLAAIHDRIKSLLNAADSNRSSGTSSNPAIDAIGSATARLGLLLTELEQTCGVNMDSILESMKPISIGPDDPIGLNLTPTEKQMILQADAMPAFLIERVRQSPPGRRKLEFTLAQVNEMHASLAVTIQSIADRQSRRRWEAIHSKLADLQFKYVCGDDEPGSLDRAAAGEPVSSAAAVRELIERIRQQRSKPKA